MSLAPPSVPYPWSIICTLERNFIESSTAKASSMGKAGRTLVKLSSESKRRSGKQLALGLL
jgi:hypothetical protein